MITKVTQARQKLLRLHKYDPRLSNCAKNLHRVHAETSQRTEGSYLAPSEGRTKGLSSIFDDRNCVTLADGEQGTHLANVPGEMDGHNRPRTGGNSRFHRLWI